MKISLKIQSSKVRNLRSRYLHKLIPLSYHALFQITKLNTWKRHKAISIWADFI